ncbi:MAG: hypothetical protein ACXVDI_24350, partial [Ktedonobacterales bacterium]
MESRETQVGTTYDRPEHATVEIEDGSEMIREDEAPTVESIRPKGRRLVAGRLLSRQVMLERITPMVRGVSGKRFVT